MTLPTVTLIPIPGCRIEGPKRLNIPYRMQWVCPKCGVSHEKDLSDEDHLSSPVFGGTAQLFLYCPECDWEGQPLIKLTLTAEIVQEES